MAAFTLDSDNLYIRKNHWSPGITVLEYEEQTTIVGTVHARYPRWKNVTNISDGADSVFSALEVFGVKISGDLLMKNLTHDLTISGKEEGQRMYLLVNRRGICYVLQSGKEDPVKWLKIDGHFCWSKYGVEVKLPGRVFDEGYDTVLGSSSGVKIEEESEVLMVRKLVEEKNKEIASLKAALKALVDN